MPKGKEHPNMIKKSHRRKTSSQKKAPYIRTVTKAMELDWMPHWGISPDLYQKRNAAVLEVACRLSDDVVETLDSKTDSFYWFIPQVGNLAGLFPFPITHDNSEEEAELEAESLFVERYSKVLYLSPNLERTSFAIAVASVAHELAHIVLDHPTAGVPKKGSYWANEKAAWELVDSWGFSREAKKHANLYKRRERDAES